ncbi:cyanophycin synthetase [Nitrosovibrio sp. Nv17]|nr:cyanophycin synthetase [Nitrosovibrio sp. Nv17]
MSGDGGLMEISRLYALRGPNLWGRRTALEAVVRCDAATYRGDVAAGLRERVCRRFPGISLLEPAHRQGIPVMVHAFERAALGLQMEAGCPVVFSHAVETLEAGVYQVVVEYGEEAVGRLAVELSQALCRAAADDAVFDLLGAVARLKGLNEEIRLGPSTRAIVDAATARGIPFHRLTDGSLVQLGWGCRQRRIQAAETGATGAVAEAIAQDKELTRTLLRAAGLPVPEGRPVESARDAWKAACEIGGTVVVKPRDSGQGRGVGVDLVGRQEVEAAYAIAAEVSDDVLVERCVPGHDHRMLVVGNRLIAAARRDPPGVTGNGMHSIRELVEGINSDPRRGEDHASALTRVHFDDIALRYLTAQGLTPESILPAGARVLLRSNANLSTGGTATDVTDQVHPELAACVETAAQMVGLDVCGVDVVCASVAEPPGESGATIIEVNAAPGLRMHLQPAYGRARAVGEAIVASMFDAGDNGRIPVVAVSGTNGKTTTTRLIASILGQDGRRVGMTSTDGVYIDGRRIDTGDCSGPKSARKVLLHPDVEAAVLETARGGLLREGLGFDRCQVAVMTNIGMGDHLGLAHIHTAEALSAVKRIIVQNVTPGTGVAVLNADDPLVARMAEHCPGSIIYFSLRSDNPVIATHRARHGRTLHLEGQAMIATGPGGEYRLPLNRVPVTQEGAIAFQIENAMAAAGAGWGLGLGWKTIQAGLGAFAGDVRTTPGRFNLFTHRGATLIADYGHNTDAIRALVRAIDGMPAKRRSVVISGAGDRRDEDIRQQTRILGDAFDEVVLYQDRCQRGRMDGEVLGLLRQGLANASRARDIKEIRGEFMAIDAAFASLKAGELCLILVDQVEEALGYIAKRIFAG